MFFENSRTSNVWLASWNCNSGFARFNISVIILSSIFPIVIEYTGPHGLEPDAIKGIDYKQYELIKDSIKLPINCEFRIIATRVFHE